MLFLFDKFISEKGKSEINFCLCEIGRKGICDVTFCRRD